VTNPEGAIIWVINLDGTEPPVTTPVEPDGSFEVLVDGDLDQLFTGDLRDEYRLQVRTGELRSEPIDFVANLAEGTLLVSERPLEDCFSLEPQTELHFGEISLSDTLEILLSNHCDETLTFEATRLRAPAPSFDLGEGPLSLDVEQTASVRVTFAPERDGLIEEIMMVEVLSPTGDRRPITISGLRASD
jgi:hypothetical protein